MTENLFYAFIGIGLVVFPLILYIYFRRNKKVLSSKRSEDSEKDSMTGNNKRD